MVRLLDDKREEDVLALSVDIRPPLLLPAYRIPYTSIAWSVLLHGALWLILTSARIGGRLIPPIDPDHEKVTLYRLSEGFPDIAPLLKGPASPEEKLGNRPEPSFVPESGSQAEIAINSRQPNSPPQLLEQPDFPKMTSLPKLELPNILMTQSETKVGDEPVSVTEKVNRDLSQELRVRTAEIVQASQPELKVSDPLPVPQSPTVADLHLKSPSFNFVGKADLQLPTPVEPSTASTQVSQLESRMKSFGPNASVLVAPPVDDPKVDGHVEQLLPSTAGDTLIYSADPSLPKVISLPKTNASGNINASPQGGAGSGAGTGTPDFGNASIAIPGVSIKNHAPVILSGNPGVAVQGPKLLQPSQIPDRPERHEIAIPKAPAPPLHGTLKIAPLDETARTAPPASPLEEVERQGKEIYTTSINAPNFTSKRGSWIFRFAELTDSSSIQSDSQSQTTSSATEAITAPIATFKVDPRYPPELIREKVEGVVVLYAILRKDGTVDPQTVRLIRKLDSRLEVSAKEALISWKFKPSCKHGQPVDIQAEITIPFYFRKDPL
jgi:TonB family protein